MIHYWWSSRYSIYSTWHDMTLHGISFHPAREQYNHLYWCIILHRILYACFLETRVGEQVAGNKAVSRKRQLNPVCVSVSHSLLFLLWWHRMWIGDVSWYSKVCLLYAQLTRVSATGIQFHVFGWIICMHADQNNQHSDITVSSWCSRFRTTCRCIVLNHPIYLLRYYSIHYSICLSWQTILSRYHSVEPLASVPRLGRSNRLQELSWTSQNTRGNNEVIISPIGGDLDRSIGPKWFLLLTKFWSPSKH